MKYYLESLKYYRTVEYTKAAGLLQKAIELDPQFALAYAALGGVYVGMGDQKSHECRKKAFELKDRLPDKERYFVEANYYLNFGERMAAKTIEAYEKYFEYAPHDAGEINSLGYVYGDYLEDYERGLEQMEKAYRIDQAPQILMPHDASLRKAGTL